MDSWWKTGLKGRSGADVIHPFLPGQDQQGCSHCLRQKSLQPRAACRLPLVSAGRNSVLVTCCPWQGHSPSQHLLLPQWRNPPSSSDLLFSGRGHTAPGLHTPHFINSCSDLLLKTFSSEDLTSSKCSLGWCFIFSQFLLTAFLAPRQNSPPWPSHHSHKAELCLKPLCQLSHSPSFPRPWFSKPPPCPPLDFPNNDSLSKMLHLVWAPPAHPSQTDGFLLSPSQLLFTPVYNSLFGLFCTALGSQLAPCLRPAFPQFRLRILFSSSKCKIGFGCVCVCLFSFFYNVFFRTLLKCQPLSRPRTILSY